MASIPDFLDAGPFTADQIRDGDPYELSNGHPILCLPGGVEHAARNLQGGALLESDPDVEWAGVDAGFSPNPGTLRAPDVAVASKPENTTGWIPGAPLLAVEYADRGQDKAGLKQKIADLLAAGTRYIWVVRLVGPQRVEVHTPGAPMRICTAGEELTAPGVLRNPIPVQAFFNQDEARRITFRNLLQREGYDSLNAAWQEGREEGREEGEITGQAQMLLTLLEARGMAVDDGSQARIFACRDGEHLRQWLRNALKVEQIQDIFQ